MEHILYGSPHVQSDGPLHCMEQVSYGPPHGHYDFFQPALKEIHCVT